MKYRLRPKVVLLESLASFNLQQRIHVFIDFQTLRQLAAIVIAELFCSSWIKSSMGETCVKCSTGSFWPGV